MTPAREPGGALATAAVLRTRDPDTVAAGAAKGRGASEIGPAFEAMLLREVVKAMRATVPDGGAFSGVTGRQVYDAMIEDALADHLARGPGLGIARLFDGGAAPAGLEKSLARFRPEAPEPSSDAERAPIAGGGTMMPARDPGAPLSLDLPPEEDPWLDHPGAELHLRRLLLGEPGDRK